MAVRLAAAGGELVQVVHVGTYEHLIATLPFATFIATIPASLWGIVRVCMAAISVASRCNRIERAIPNHVADSGASHGYRGADLGKAGVPVALPMLAT